MHAHTCIYSPTNASISGSNSSKRGLSSVPGARKNTSTFDSVREGGIAVVVVGLYESEGRIVLKKICMYYVYNIYIYIYIYIICILKI